MSASLWTTRAKTRSAPATPQTVIFLSEIFYDCDDKNINFHHLNVN